MNEPRLIKKYPNRRLYDTTISSYITLEDVRRLVLEQIQFRVVDARSNADITRTVLLQIISEQEEQGNPIFSTEILAQIIRFYGDTLQGMMGNYLEKSLQSFIDQQHLVREQMRNLLEQNPLRVMSDLAQTNLALWQVMNEQIYKKIPDAKKAAEDPGRDDLAAQNERGKSVEKRDSHIAQDDPEWEDSSSS